MKEESLDNLSEKETLLIHHRSVQASAYKAVRGPGGLRYTLNLIVIM
jgi:hypothetical protein